MKCHELEDIFDVGDRRAGCGGIARDRPRRRNRWMILTRKLRVAGRRRVVDRVLSEPEGAIHAKRCEEPLIHDRLVALAERDLKDSSCDVETTVAVAPLLARLGVLLPILRLRDHRLERVVANAG